MRISPAELAKSIGSLDDLDPEHGFAIALQQVVDTARVLFDADAAGLMLVDGNGELRWASASDQQAAVIEQGQERLAQGPCADAFAAGAPVLLRDLLTEGRWEELRQVLRAEGVRAALSVPVELGGELVGTLDIYSGRPREWDASEVGAIQAYAGVVATLLGSAHAVHVKGHLADQLQVALDRRVLIEQAKGALMARDGDSADSAYERIRAAARNSRRTALEIARAVLAGVPLPPAAPPRRRA